MPFHFPAVLSPAVYIIYVPRLPACLPAPSVYWLDSTRFDTIACLPAMLNAMNVLCVPASRALSLWNANARRCRYSTKHKTLYASNVIGLPLAVRLMGLPAPNLTSMRGAREAGTFVRPTSNVLARLVPYEPGAMIFGSHHRRTPQSNGCAETKWYTQRNTQVERQRRVGPKTSRIAH